MLWHVLLMASSVRLRMKQKQVDPRLEAVQGPGEGGFNPGLRGQRTLIEGLF